MNTVDSYLAQLDQPQRQALEHISDIIKQLVPDMEYGYSYKMPCFKHQGYTILWFYAFKDHLSIFPEAEPIEVFKDRLKGYKVSKGTIQFTPEHPLPDDLIKDIIKLRLEAIAHKINGKKE